MRRYAAASVSVLIVSPVNLGQIAIHGLATLEHGLCQPHPVVVAVARLAQLAVVAVGGFIKLGGIDRAHPVDSLPERSAASRSAPWLDDLADKIHATINGLNDGF